MPLTATHLFRLEDMWITADAKGFHKELRYRDHTCHVRLPGDGVDLGPCVNDIDFPAITRLHGSINGDYTAMAISVLRIDVEFDSDLTAAILPGEADNAREDEAKTILSESVAVAGALLTAIIAELRVTCGQYWLTPPAHFDPIKSEMRDMHGTEFPIAHAVRVELYLGDYERALDRETLERLLAEACLSTSPHPLAERLLSDALFAGLRAPNPNLQVGLLLAAIATEVKVKRILQDSARPEQAALVDLLLTKPRDWSMAVAALFDEPMKIVAGVSCREVDKPLFRAIQDLFTHRNDVAHRGKADLDADSIRTDLQTAVKAFAWLDARSRTDNGPRLDGLSG